MKTEPIEFKGTLGEWYFQDHDPKISKYFGNIISTLRVREGGSKDIRTITVQLKHGTEEENAANAKLMAASKYLAIALQDLIERCNECSELLQKEGSNNWMKLHTIYATGALIKAGLIKI